MGVRASMRELRLRVKAEGDRAVAIWDDDDPREALSGEDRPVARYYAPRGECGYCDRRRDAAARSMRRVREAGRDE